MAKAKQKAKPAKKAAPKKSAKSAAKKSAPKSKSKAAPARKAPAKPGSKPLKSAPTKNRKTTPAKPSPTSKPTQKRKPPAPPAAPEQGFEGLDALADIRDELSGALAGSDGFRHALTVQEVAGRDAIHAELGAKLAAMRGDEQQERAAIASAIESYMQLAIADGLEPDASAYAAQCPEFFWEGDGANPPVYARVPDATHDEIGRWFQLIVEGVRAYDSRVGASAPN
jgi:hypothetical protein